MAESTQSCTFCSCNLMNAGSTAFKVDESRLACFGCVDKALAVYANVCRDRHYAVLYDDKFYVRQLSDDATELVLQTEFCPLNKDEAHRIANLLDAELIEPLYTQDSLETIKCTAARS